MFLRIATAADVPALARLFHRAVREGPSPYTARQRAAWMPQPPDPVLFAARLADKHVVLWQEAREVAGFMTLEPGGYINLAYILHDHRGKGVFRGLYTAIEDTARNRAETRLWTHASLMAQPAFMAMGFTVMHHETVVRDGEHLARAQMEKSLT